MGMNHFLLGSTGIFFDKNGLLSHGNESSLHFTGIHFSDGIGRLSHGNDQFESNYFPIGMNHTLMGKEDTVIICEWDSATTSIPIVFNHL